MNGLQRYDIVTAERRLDLVPPRLPSELRFLFEPTEMPPARSPQHMRKAVPYRTMRLLTWSLLRLAVRGVAAQLLDRMRRASPVLFIAHGGWGRGAL